MRGPSNACLLHCPGQYGVLAGVVRLRSGRICGVFGWDFGMGSPFSSRGGDVVLVVGPKAVVDVAGAGVLVDAETQTAATVVVGAPVPTAIGALKVLDHRLVLHPAGGTLAAPARALDPWAPQFIIYPSGTTGPAMGVLSSYLHIYTLAGHEPWLFVTYLVIIIFCE